MDSLPDKRTGMLRQWLDKSLRVKFFGLGLVIVCVSTLASALIISHSEAGQWNRFLQDKAYSLASYIADVSKEQILSGDRIQLDNIVKKINNDPEIVSAVIYDGHGRLLTGLFASLNLKNPVVKTIVVETPIGTDLAAILSRIRERLGICEVSVPVVMGHESLGRVGIMLSQDNVQEGMRRTREGIVLGNLLSLFIAFLLFLWFQGIIINPVLELFRVMTRVSRKKDYTLRVDIRSRDELGLLGRGFNAMIEQVQHHHERLEEEVAKRTQQLVVTNKKIQEEIVERIKAEDSLKKAYDDLKSLQDQLIQSEKMASVGELAAGVAHEINNPVGFIASNLEVLSSYVAAYQDILEMMSRLESAAVKRSWEEADVILAEIRKFEERVNFNFMVRDVNTLITQSREGVDRIQKIITDLRAFEREETLWLEEEVEVEAVMDKVLAAVQAEFPRAVETRKDYTKTPPVRFDAKKIERVLSSIIRNAMQAVAESGRIDLKTSVVSGCVYAQVADTGPGIPPQILKRIFDPFFTTRPAGQGTGLGLSISYEIVKKRGGEIRVSSEVGKGAVFTVVLPLPVGKPDKEI